MTQQRNDTPGPAAGGGQIQHALKLRDQFPSWLAPARKVVWKNGQITLASSNFQPWEQFPADLFQSSSVKPAFMVDYQPKGSCHLPSGRGHSVVNSVSLWKNSFRCPACSPSNVSGRHSP